MKIKIVKKLSEKYEFSPTSAQSLNDLFKNLGVIERNIDGLDKIPEISKTLSNLFDNDLMFYDLETTGLSRKDLDENGDMIHQIAVLVYNSTQDFSSIDAKNPDAAYVAKAEIPRQLEERTEEINTLRGEFLLNYIKQPSLIGGFFEDENKLLNNGIFSNDPSENGGGYSPEQVMGLFYYMFSNKRPKKNGTYMGAKSRSKIYPFIVLYAKQSVSIFIDNDLKIEKEDTAKERKEFVKKFKDWLTSNKDIKKEQLGNFFKSIFRPSITEPDIIEYFKNIGLSDAAKEIQSLVNFYETQLIGTTVEENKVFTHYDDFPLSQYRNPKNKNYINQSQQVADGNAEMPVSEEDALRGLAEFVNKYPDGTLVGQNIISFDNPFVLVRCEAYGINTEVFRNLGVYDARFFFSAVIKYLEVFKYIYNIFNAGDSFTRHLVDQNAKNEFNALKQTIFEPHKEDLKRFFNETKEILSNLQKGGRAKGKLETLIKTFVGPKVKQTHTADDDCEKLAEVFIKSIQPFHEIYENTIDFVNSADQSKLIQAIRYARKRLGLSIQANLEQEKTGYKSSDFEKIRGPLLRNKVVSKMAADWINYIDKSLQDPREKDILKDFIEQPEIITKKTKDDKVKTITKNKLDYLIQDQIQNYFVSRKLTDDQKVFYYRQLMSLGEDDVGNMLSSVNDEWNKYLENALRNQNNTTPAPPPPTPPAAVTESKRLINIKIIKG